MGGLLQVERLEHDDFVLDAALLVGRELAVGQAFGLALALEAFGGLEGVEEIGARAEEEGVERGVFALAFGHFGYCRECVMT